MGSQGSGRRTITLCCTCFLLCLCMDVWWHSCPAIMGSKATQMRLSVSAV